MFHSLMETLEAYQRRDPAARSKLESAGFFMRAAGAATYLGSSSKAQGQSVAGGETAAIGTIVDVTFSTPQVEDGYLYDG